MSFLAHSARGALRIVIYRCSFAKVSDWTLNVVCDDVMTLWIDGEETKVDGQGVWNQLSTLDIPMSTRSIAIKCQNTGGPGGIAASVQDAYG